MIFIAHDLAVVKNISDRVAVMYLGKICEVAGADDAVPATRPTLHRRAAEVDPGPRPTIRPDPETRIKGELPSPLFPPSGCRFRTRCPLAQERCAVEEPHAARPRRRPLRRLPLPDRPRGSTAAASPGAERRRHRLRRRPPSGSCSSAGASPGTRPSPPDASSLTLAMICWRFSRSMAACMPGDLQRRPHALLGEGHAERRVEHDLVGLGVGRVEQRVVGHDLGDEPDAAGLVGVEHPAGEHQLLGPGGTDEPRQQPAGADVARRQPDADEGGVEAGRGRGDADVGAEHEGEAATRRPAPLTAAITGCGSERRCGMSVAMCFCTAKPAWVRAEALGVRRLRRSHRRSRPAQKPRPAPVSTTTRHARIDGDRVEGGVQALRPARSSWR